MSKDDDFADSARGTIINSPTHPLTLKDLKRAYEVMTKSLNSPLITVEDWFEKKDKENEMLIKEKAMNKTQMNLINWLIKNNSDIFYWRGFVPDKQKPGIFMFGKILDYPFRVFRDYDGKMWCGIYDETAKGSIVPAFYTMTELKRWYKKTFRRTK
jgi:hypothetical protein